MTTGILYSRVSTAEQARSGYSLRQQMEALREWARNEGCQIIEEIEDPGQSGASLVRPGMDRVRDLVAAGGVDVVVAQDRDRLSRDPIDFYVLKNEFAMHGCTMRALGDWGDDASPQGEFSNDIQVAAGKYERRMIAERNRRGKRKKAREGKLIAGHSPNYGFRYNEARDGYEVDEEQMAVVQRIFEIVGVRKMSMWSVKRTLDREGVPTPPTPRKKKHPEEGRQWSKRFIRDVIEADVYRPHSYDEIAAFVTPEVAARLDRNRFHGIWWFGRRNTTVEKVVEVGPDGTREYRKRQTTVLNPIEQWTAVPVPDAGIPREVVDAARARIKDRKPTSSAGDRVWQLSGGVMYCGCCGNRMVANRVLQPKSKKPAFYYRCPKRQHEGKEACPESRHHRAEPTEALIWEAVADFLNDPEALRLQYDRLIERVREGLRRDPDREIRAWAVRLAEAERKRSAFHDMAAERLITFHELREKLADLDDLKEAAEREMERLRGSREMIEFMEQERDYVLGELAKVGPQARRDMTPEDRSEQYRGMGLKVTARPDGSYELSGTMFGMGQGIVVSGPSP